MGMTAARLRERRAAIAASLPRPAPPTRQLTAEERIERLREENRALRQKIAELQAAQSPAVAVQQSEEPEPQEVVKPKPAWDNQKPQGKRRG